MHQNNPCVVDSSRSINVYASADSVCCFQYQYNSILFTISIALAASISGG